MKYLIAIIVFCSSLFAKQVCSSPKYSLVDTLTYTCDKPDYTPMWTVLYYQGRVFVFTAEWGDGQVADVPVAFRSKSSNFIDAGETLHVFLTKDATGKFIRLEGTR